MKYYKQIIIAIVVILLLIVAIRAQVEINKLQEKVVDLESELAQLEHEKNKKEQILNAPIDDDYIAQQAEDRLGYRDPSTQYFYNDIPN